MTDEEVKVVSFESAGNQCKAALIGGFRTLNMRSCVLNLKDTDKVNIEYTPESARITVNNGDIWFDTSEKSAAEIEDLFSI